MKWFWLFVIVARFISIVRSDEQKRKQWKEMSEHKWTPQTDRFCAVLILALAVWQALTLWGPR